MQMKSVMFCESAKNTLTKGERDAKNVVFNASNSLKRVQTNQSWIELWFGSSEINENDCKCVVSFCVN